MPAMLLGRHAIHGFQSLQGLKGLKGLKGFREALRMKDGTFR
jgi:hypothetical protein